MPNWLVVLTHLKHISKIGSFSQVGVKIKHVWNHHLANVAAYFRSFPKPNFKNLLQDIPALFTSIPGGFSGLTGITFYSLVAQMVGIVMIASKLGQNPI